MESKYDPMLTTALLLKVPWIRRVVGTDQAQPCGGPGPRLHRMANAAPVCSRQPLWVVTAGLGNSSTYHLCTQHFSMFLREDAWAVMNLERWMEEVGNDLAYEALVDQ